jgi:tetratricopeptide (TPR) repeat protein
MICLFIGLLGALVAGSQPAGVTNQAAKTGAVPLAAADPNDPVEKEFQQLMAEDNAAQAEVDKWIESDQESAAKGAGVPADELNQRIRARFEPVQRAYRDFITRHPNHVPARLTYASFLDDLHDEEGELAQLDRARELDPKNPAVWNQLANYHGHNGEVKKAFEFYAKAI